MKENTPLRCFLAPDPSESMHPDTGFWRGVVPSYQLLYRLAMNTDRPLAGMLLMTGFCVLAPLGDAMAKLVGGNVPLLQLLLVRFGIQALLLLPIVWFTVRTLRSSRRVFLLTFYRTILHIAGIGCMFLSLRYLPLADAVAIAFVMPLIMLLLGKTFLNEDVGARRLIACIVGFGGTLMVVQPSFSEVGAPALLPLAVAVVFALFMLVTRQIARETDAISLQAMSGVMATIVLSAVYFLAPADAVGDLALVNPEPGDAVLLAAIGVLGTVAHLLMTWSLRFAPAATLAPMQYLEIPIATLIGWIVFSDLPNGLAAMGIAVTVASGLYVISRERAAARPAVQTVPV